MEQKNDKKEEKCRTISRRRFPKSTGVAGLTVGAIVVGEENGRHILDLKANEVEKSPYISYTYEGVDKLERFDERLTAFASKKVGEGKRPD